VIHSKAELEFRTPFHELSGSARVGWLGFVKGIKKIHKTYFGYGRMRENGLDGGMGSSLFDALNPLRKIEADGLFI
jgi:hypothetical protein